MAVNTKAIKNRIKSVKNTKKITKAMEMVSAAKMRRAVENALGTRSYAELALELLVNISKNRAVKHPLVEAPKKGKTLILLIASNKGLCGSYNSNINKELVAFVANHKKDEVDYISVGKKAERAIKKQGANPIASFIDFADNLKIEQISGLSKIIIDEFNQGKYRKAMMIYTNFVSSISFKAETRPLLPVSEENIKGMIKELGKGGISEEDMRLKSLSQYVFEPDEETILNEVLPRLTEVQIYQALLESIASEHSARMMAMRNASESAEEMIDDLSLNFNRARQAGITQEITEISAGAAALG